MPKQLIIESTIVNYGDDRGGVHEDRGAIVDVPKETARTLAAVNRALYVNRTDDPDKGGRNTATAEMLKAAADMARGAKKSAPAE